MGPSSLTWSKAHEEVVPSVAQNWKRQRTGSFSVDAKDSDADLRSVKKKKKTSDLRWMQMMQRLIGVNPIDKHQNWQ